MSFLIPAAILLGASLLALSSIAPHLFWAQLAFISLGIAMLVVVRFVFRGGMPFLRARWFRIGIYALSVVLLVAAAAIAPVIRQTQSWLVLGPFRFQPVELAKFALIIVLADYFSRRHMTVGRFKHLFLSGAIFALPAALTLLQPDLGSALLLFGVWFGFLLVSGLPRRWIISFFILFCALGIAGWTLFLKPYQKDRILAVIYPDRNALGVNYNVIQSKIAIGSGGFWGKGYGQGSQVQLGFLPEAATDFILPAFVEEWGFAGGLVILFATGALILGILKVGRAADDNFTNLVCLGAALLFTLQFLVNAGSAVGFLPVVGVTFPFLSYGGSSLIINSVLLASIFGLSRR